MMWSPICVRRSGRCARRGAEPQPVATAAAVGPQRQVPGARVDQLGPQLGVAAEPARGEQRGAGAHLAQRPVGAAQHGAADPSLLDEQALGARAQHELASLGLAHRPPAGEQEARRVDRPPAAEPEHRDRPAHLDAQGAQPVDGRVVVVHEPARQGDVRVRVLASHHLERRGAPHVPRVGGRAADRRCLLGEDDGCTLPRRARGRGTPGHAGSQHEQIDHDRHPSGGDQIELSSVAR